MPFQFYCPQGHLLEGHESQAGQQGQCPICGSMFVMPGGVPNAASSMPASYPAAPPPGGFIPPDQNFAGSGPADAFAPPEPPGFPSVSAPHSEGFPSLVDPAAGASIPPSQPPLAESAKEPPPPEPKLYHIPCPNGHILETPSDMLSQQALCPYCNTQFELRREDSEEYQVEKAEAAARRKEAFDKTLVKWSIYLAIFVGVMFLIMVIWAVFG